MAVTRMDNVGIVVESLDTAISFFAELGMKLEGRTTIEGEWAGRVTGLGLQRVEIAMLFEHLDTERPLSGDHGLVIERMNECKTEFL